jgi:hypothetical protein
LVLDGEAEFPFVATPPSWAAGQAYPKSVKWTASSIGALRGVALALMSYESMPILRLRLLYLADLVWQARPIFRD